MKRERLDEIVPGITKEQKDLLMAEIGKDVEGAKASAKAEVEELTAKLKKANEDLTAAKTGGGEELQKAQAEIGKLQKELGDLKTANTVRDIRAKVAKEKGLDPELLTADTEEDCTAQADKLLAFANARNGYPPLPNPGEQSGGSGQTTRDKFAEWSKNAF